MAKNIVLGVDIGGSHITAGLIDITDGILLPGSVFRRSVDSKGTVEEIMTAWCEIIAMASMTCINFSGKIAIAMPGPFDYEKGISLIKNSDKYEALYGLNVKSLLSDFLSNNSENIRFVNDAGCFLRGEVARGAATGFSRAIGITLGTGLGTSRYSDGIAEDADLWHSPYKEGIAEDYLSTRWFLNSYRKLSDNSKPDLKGVKELAALIPSYTGVKQLFEEFGTNLGRFIAEYIRTDQPEVVVIGGNIAKAGDLIFPIVRKIVREQFQNIPVRKALLGEEAALIGAAYSLQDDFHING